MINQFKQKLSIRAVELDIQGPHSIEEIAEAEACLGIKLPNSFKEYLVEFGNVAFGSIEYLGLTKTRCFEGALYPNFVWFNLKRRVESGFPSHLIIVKSEDNQRYICIDSDRKLLCGDFGMTIWDNVDRDVFEELDISFLDYLMDDIDDCLS